MKIKTLFFIIVIAGIAMAGCKKLSEPVEVLPGNSTLTPLPGAQITQTAVALLTAGIGPQQTATAAAIATLAAQSTQTVVALDPPVLTFGEYGNGAGELVAPGDIAVDSSGSIYIADRGMNKIVKFNSLGVYQFEWGSSGTGTGEFSGLGSITVDTSNNVYATDYYSDVTEVSRIQKFSSAGAYITSWGAYDYGGTADGNFSNLQDVVCYSGKIYVMDNYYGMGTTYRLHRFDQNGNFEAKYEHTPGSYSYSDYNYLTPGNSGNWYLIQNYSNTFLQELSSSFLPVGQWSNPGVDPGEYYVISAAASDTSGNIYIWDAYGGKIIKYSPSFVYVKEWQVFQTMSLEGLLGQSGTRLTVDSAGNVYLLMSTYLMRVYKFAP
jgi:hypothetical protein